MALKRKIEGQSSVAAGIKDNRKDPGLASTQGQGESLKAQTKVDRFLEISASVPLLFTPGVYR